MKTARGASARHPQGVGDERDRAAQRPGRRDRAGAPQARKPSERSERPASEGYEQSLSARPVFCRTTPTSP